MRDIQRIYLYNFLAGLASAVAVIQTLYFLSYHLSQSQVGSLTAVFFLCLAILDIPTGGLADTFGHKKSVIAGTFFQMVASILLATATNYYSFALAMICSGIGYALLSGAYQSLLNDILRKADRADDYTKVSGRASSCLMIGAMLASPLTSVIYSQHSQAVYWISAFLLGLSGLVILTIKSDFIGPKPSFDIYFNKISKGISLALKRKTILALLSVSIVMGSTNSLFNINITQPLLLNLGLGVASVGTVLAIFSGLEALLLAYSHLVLEKFGVWESLILMVVLPALAVTVLSQVNNQLGLILMIIFLLGNAFRGQVISTLLQKEVNPEERSTMLSTVSFLTFISLGLLAPIGGKGVDLLGIKTMLLLFGPIILVVGLSGSALYQRYREA